MIALVPRRGALLRDTIRRFDEAANRNGLVPHQLDSGIAIAVAARAAVSRNAAAIGEMFAQGSGRHRPLGGACDAIERDGDIRAGCKHWGNYIVVAGARDRPGSLVYRAPFGDLPCFWMHSDEAVLVATSPALLAAFAARGPVIDWRALAVYLLSPEMRGEGTCLEGVRELPGGCMLRVSTESAAVERHWSPWTFDRAKDPIANLDEAAQVVGQAIDAAVAARCRELHQPVLLLSGGLDSSTVAAALTQAGCTFAALTMVTRQKSGDERNYARAVANTTGTALTERMRSMAAIDWEDATPLRLARPSARLFRHPTLAAAGRLARELGTDTIVDGGGGDNLFCSLHSVVPLLDRLAVERYGRGTWSTARDIALRADVGLGTVMAKTVQRVLSRRAAFRWATDASFLTDAAAALHGEASSHSWLEPPRGTLPGEAAHVALILGAIGLAEDDSIDPTLQTISPLVAQPVVEVALRVRSWLWFAGGRSRAVIRHAYAGRLPQSVLGRTGKGTPAGFMAEIVDANRERLRELLLDGLLAAHGVIDRDEVERALSASAQGRDSRFSRLLVIADGERWARLWTA